MKCLTTSTAKRTPPRVGNKFPSLPLKQRLPVRCAEKYVAGNLFLVLVPQGLELLLALVLGDLSTPFFLEIAHDDTTFVQFINKTDCIII